MSDFNQEYYRAVDQLIDSNQFADNDLDDMLNSKYHHIDEVARDEVINQVINDAINRRGPGSGTGSGYISSEAASAESSLIHSLAIKLQELAIPATVATVLAKAAAPVLVAGGTGAAVKGGAIAGTAVGGPVGGILAGILAGVLGHQLANGVASVITKDENIMSQAHHLAEDPSAPSIIDKVKDFFGIINVDEKYQELLNKQSEAAHTAYASSGVFPKAKDNDRYRDAKASYRAARAQKLLNQEVEDIIAMTGGPDENDPEQLEKRQKLLNAEKLRDSAAKYLDQADSEFEHAFDTKFRDMTASKQDLSHATPKDYDNYIEAAINDIEKTNQALYNEARARSQEIARMKSTPEYAERLQKAANNYLNSNVSGKASIDAKMDKVNRLERQTQRIVDTDERLGKALTAEGLGGKDLSTKFKDPVEWKDLIGPTAKAKLHTDDMSAEEFKRIRDGLAQAGGQVSFNNNPTDETLEKAARAIRAKQ